jgi:hypothetical protein
MATLEVLKYLRAAHRGRLGASPTTFRWSAILHLCPLAFEQSTSTGHSYNFSSWRLLAPSSRLNDTRRWGSLPAIPVKGAATTHMPQAAIQRLLLLLLLIASTLVPEADAFSSLNRVAPAQK